MPNSPIIARKRAYVRNLEEMRDNEIAREIDFLEASQPSAFNLWKLREATAELNHRI